MNKLILFIILLATISCSDRKDGIYQADNGWDIVENGKTYQYRCETDGLYLYIDWDGENSYIIGFRHKYEVTAFAHLKFLCKNKDNKYVYVANYPDINIYFYDLNEIEFNIGEGRSLIYQYKPNKMCFSLLEKYTTR